MSKEAKGMLAYETKRHTFYAKIVQDMCLEHPEIILEKPYEEYKASVGLGDSIYPFARFAKTKESRPKRFKTEEQMIGYCMSEGISMLAVMHLNEQITAYAIAMNLYEQITTYTM